MLPFHQLNDFIRALVNKNSDTKLTIESLEKQSDLYQELLRMNDEIFNFVNMKDLKKDDSFVGQDEQNNLSDLPEQDDNLGENSKDGNDLIEDRVII